jgi:hypothetical protein
MTTAPRDKNNTLQETFEWSFPHGAITGTTTFKVRKPKRDFVIDSASYHNVTGLATHADNNYVGVLKIGATAAVAMFNTDADSDPVGAAIAADTWTDGVPSAVSGALNGVPDDEVTLVCTKGSGAATLPAGQLVIRGRYIK